MRGNFELGFRDLADNEEIDAEGDGGGPLTMYAELGQRGKVYRIYGYLYQYDQDASREGIRGECCARGESAIEAIYMWAGNASDLGWFPQGIARIKMEMLDAVAELEEVS